MSEGSNEGITIELLEVVYAMAGTPVPEGYLDLSVLAAVSQKLYVITQQEEYLDECERWLDLRTAHMVACTSSECPCGGKGRGNVVNLQVIEGGGITTDHPSARTQFTVIDGGRA